MEAFRTHLFLHYALGMDHDKEQYVYQVAHCGLTTDFCRGANVHNLMDSNSKNVDCEDCLRSSQRRDAGYNLKDAFNGKIHVFSRYYFDRTGSSVANQQSACGQVSGLWQTVKAAVECEDCLAAVKLSDASLGYYQNIHQLYRFVDNPHQKILTTVCGVDAPVRLAWNVVSDAGLVTCPTCMDKAKHSYGLSTPPDQIKIRQEQTKKVLQDISLERLRQINKHGPQDKHQGKDWLVILMEEVGEAARELWEGNDCRLREELVHSAAVIVAWLTKLDACGKGGDNE